HHSDENENADDQENQRSDEGYPARIGVTDTVNAEEDKERDDQGEPRVDRVPPVKMREPDDALSVTQGSADVSHNRLRVRGDPKRAQNEIPFLPWEWDFRGVLLTQIR